MAKFCPECGRSINDDQKFCSECGIHIDSVVIRNNDDIKNKDHSESNEVKYEIIPQDKKKPKSKFYYFSVFCFGLATVIFLLFLSQNVFGDTQSGTLGISQNDNPTFFSFVSPTESPKVQKIRILKEIVENYNKEHTYIGDDIFDCEKMAMDVWDIVETKGINAVIQVGNVDKKVIKIEDANHAWVLAEVAPEDWIALETTGGYLVCENEAFCAVNNPLYYQGWSFENPKELNEAYEKLMHPCDDGYILGTDDICHEACGGTSYCTGNSICVGGECRGCDSGYILGDDLKCHQPCGSTTTYCTGDSICINGKCRGCDSGYILGDDLKCHQPCGSTTTYCGEDSVCINGECRGCDPGYYIGTDLRCHRY